MDVSEDKKLSHQTYLHIGSLKNLKMKMTKPAININNQITRRERTVTPHECSVWWLCQAINTKLPNIDQGRVCAQTTLQIWINASLTMSKCVFNHHCSAFLGTFPPQNVMVILTFPCKRPASWYSFRRHDECTETIQNYFGWC